MGGPPLRARLVWHGWLVTLTCLVSAMLVVRGPGGAQNPQIAVDPFSSQVYPVLEGAECQSCHNPNGVASPTRLHFPERGASSQQIERFGRSLIALVDKDDPEQSLLLHKPTMRVPHGGGRRITPGTPEEAALISWVRRLASMPEVQIGATLAAEPAPEESSPRLVIRRLTHSQYNNTVRDLLADATRPAGQFPPEDFVHGFKTQYEAQSIPPLLVEAYSLAAERLARNAFRGGDGGNLIPCLPTSPADAVCRDKFIRSFGLKAFRRPLTQEEVSSYGALFDEEVRAETQFLKGAEVVVESMLQSPNFLFRIGNSGNPEWRPYEIAANLSYFLWDSMPDGRLFDSAASGELDSPEGVEQAARWMLADPKARQAVDEFVSQWLRFDRLLSAVKDRRQYPQFNPELARSMAEETRRFIWDLVWNNGDFMDIFRAGYSFLTPDLAALYKLPEPDGEFARVQFPADSERAGILGHASLLALTSKPAETSPTARGLFVREQFLCQEVPQPPPGVSTNLPPVTEARPMTNRERLAAHTDESCASCHRLIDPIGFGFEKFDAIGGYRDKQVIAFVPTRAERNRGVSRVELPVETHGTIVGIPDADFSSPKELGMILAESPVSQECIVKQLFRYGVGRMETPADRQVVGQCMEAFRSSGFSFQELMAAMATLTSH